MVCSCLVRHYRTEELSHGWGSHCSWWLSWQLHPRLYDIVSEFEHRTWFLWNDVNEIKTVPIIILICSRFALHLLNCEQPPFWTHWHLHISVHRLIKTQIGHARDFAWYRGQRPSSACVIPSHERVQIHANENLWSYAIFATFLRAWVVIVRHLYNAHRGRALAAISGKVPSVSGCVSVPMLWLPDCVSNNLLCALLMFSPWWMVRYTFFNKFLTCIEIC